MSTLYPLKNFYVQIIDSNFYFLNINSSQRALKVQGEAKSLKLKPEDPPSAKSLTVSTTDKTFDCLLGGKAVKLVKDKTVPCNIMSSMLFKKLIKSNIKISTMENFSFKSGNFKFIGYATYKIEINSLVKYITFSIREGKEDFVIVANEKSRELKLY